MIYFIFAEWKFREGKSRVAKAGGLKRAPQGLILVLNGGIVVFALV